MCMCVCAFYEWRMWRGAGGKDKTNDPSQNKGTGGGKNACGGFEGLIKVIIVNPLVWSLRAVLGEGGNGSFGGSGGCSPLCSGPLYSCRPLSPPTVYHWETIISLLVLHQNGQIGVCCFYFLLSFRPFSGYIQHLTAATEEVWKSSQSAPTSLPLLSCSISRHFRVHAVRRGEEGRGREGTAVTHPLWRKAGRLAPKCWRYSNQLSGCGPTVSMSC